MAELVDAHDSKSCYESSESSILSLGTHESSTALSGCFVYMGAGAGIFLFAVKQGKNTEPGIAKNFR